MSQLVKKVVVILSASLPFIAYGQSPVPVRETLPESPVKSFNDVLGFIDKALGWLFTLLLVYATFMVLSAAYLYLTSEGDEKKVQDAHNKLLYAAVGVAVAFLARGVVSFVQNFLGVN
ncbi:MAG: hypothetical protein A2586_00315 [Candidatus Harrisonbacteria bacterium RIFOXYD1_FULL_40_9]|uniref:DUF4134 domain-containing protein n=1 Tax=Candidatus Harrisonbacteria bacterium RIFOXYD1_FULL_40_9 TaxID=1798412 RepID=A0A1G1ZYD2_9BACT|nr:MAG: hypothetical protein A2586_00315 [Candidatus Harrisonbacteria bacterium RIFOXYD1_FULL_40_9]